MSLEGNNNRTALAAVLVRKPRHYRQGAVTCNGDTHQFINDNNSRPSEIVFLKPANPRTPVTGEASQFVAAGYGCSYGPAVQYLNGDNRRRLHVPVS